MNIRELDDRECDRQGCGHFGAPRGVRSHNGVDLVCGVNTSIYSPISGKVTKIGWPYRGATKNHIRYVQVTSGGYDFRIFYINPIVEIGQLVTTKSVLGHSQELSCFYPGIKDHIHFEIKNESGDFIDPTPSMMMMRCL